jgi:ankyrin repeat protein
MKPHKLVLLAGANPNVSDNASGSTPLHLAASRGHAEVVDALISNGARVDAVTRIGDTALDAVGLLISKGADVNALDAF